MDGDPGALVEHGQKAVATGDWLSASRAFEAALEQQESGAAHFGLGIASFWLGETETALHSWERAYVAFREGSAPAEAAMAAVYLCLAFRMSLGDDAAAAGWLGRAARLVDQHGLDAESGWVLLCRAHLDLDGGRPASAEAWARGAFRFAGERGDADLELCALSELGAALIEQGRLAEGASLLDEAMAGAMAGEGRDLDAVVLISCRAIGACSRGGDFRRATKWVRTAHDLYRQHGSPHLYATCRTQYGSVLFATGNWEQAEKELVAALAVGKSAEPLLHAEALAKLAELRLAQGAPDEAARLLVGYEDHASAAYALASVRLARGESAVAASLLRRRLLEVDRHSLEAVALSELLVEAEIARGEHVKAMEIAVRLGELSSRVQSDLVMGRAERALGRATAAGGTGSAAAEEHFARALAAFARAELPFEIGRTRLLLAILLADREPEVAIAEGSSAFDAFARLGAIRSADAAAALLRSLGARPTRSGPGAVGDLTRREREVLALLGEGLSNRDIAERLFITRKTVEHHVASVLSKTGLSGRGAAAAYAVRHLQGQTAANRDSAAK